MVKLYNQGIASLYCRDFNFKWFQTSVPCALGEGYSFGKIGDRLFAKIEAKWKEYRHGSNFVRFPHVFPGEILLPFESFIRGLPGVCQDFREILIFAQVAGNGYILCKEPGRFCKFL